MKQFYIHTFGCQMNDYDSDRMAQLLYADGWMQSNSAKEADLLMLNTCTVRQLAEEKAFSLIGRWNKLKKDNPSLLIGMTGCLAQYLGEKAFKRAAALDFIIGPRSLTKLIDVINEAKHSGRAACFDVQSFGDGGGEVKASDQVSAYVAVMDGCDQYCTYCAVPRSRGHELSRSPEDIIKEVKRRLDQGQKEIILLGQNITRYGMDLNNGINLAELLKQVAQLDKLLRLRFLTGHPKAFTKKIISTMATYPTICESLHLPLQSGSNRILKAMNRGYTFETYHALIKDIKLAIPSITISTDIIVGFPGEGETEFEETLDAVRTIKFDMAYCFKYSPRQGTAAAQLKDQVDQAIKEERLARLLALINHQVLASKQKLLAQEVAVLVESQDDKNNQRLRGRTRTNHIVFFDGPAHLIGEEVKVAIKDAGNFSVVGEWIK